MNNVDIPKYTTKFSLKNKIYRLIWNITYYILFRPFIGNIFNTWRIFLLKLFGAKIGKGSVIYSNAKIWLPYNLIIGEQSCIGPNVFCYNPQPITIGNKVTISQNSYLCGGSHDINDLALGFISAPIVIKDFSWVCANCFVMMGVTIEEGCIIGATASLFKSTEPWGVYGGNPAKRIKERVINKNRV